MSVRVIGVETSPMVSPRGFYYPTSLDDRHISEIQAQLTELTTIDYAHSRRISWWAHQKRMLSLAKQCFPLTLGQWVMSQSKNPYLYGRRIECVFDMLSFIETGQRALSIHYWYELLEDYPHTTTRAGLTPHSQRLLEQNTWLTRPFSQTLIAWCAHPRGIEDMVWTLAVFFGAEKPDTLGRQWDQPSTLHDVKPLPAW